MKSIIFLLIIIAIYYQIYKRYPEYISKKRNIYFVSFVILYLTFLYFMRYQKGFVYKVAKNIKESEKPLYDVNSLTFKKTQMEGFKNHLALRQGWRCIHCHNPIIQKDMHLYKMDYIVPLNYGGRNDTTNLGIMCYKCSTFRPF